MFVNKCEGWHTTKNFSHGANYKKHIKSARRLLVLRPKVDLKRAEAFYTATSERTARAFLATRNGCGVFKTRYLFSEKCEKGNKEGILAE